MMVEPESIYFQDNMPGNVCFGCGIENKNGLHIQSYWKGEESICLWESEPRYQGWVKIMNGGVLATIIDCHCMGTAMAAAYREEGRLLGSEPYYRYATASIKLDYLKPTPNDYPVTLRAQIVEIKGRRTTLTCQAYSEGEMTARAEVVAVRVFEGEQERGSPFT